MEADDETTAESSKHAQTRLRYLKASPPLLGASKSASFHPTTSHLIYPSPSPTAGQLFTSVFSRSSPRVLPHPSVTTPGQQVSVSPDGEWVVIFHPYPATSGGAIAIYPASILSPITTTQAVPTHGVVPLSLAPLAIMHLYPPRIHTVSGRAAARGPRQPAAWNSRQGPVFLILTSAGISLVSPCAHPHRHNLDSDAINSSRYAMMDIHAPTHTRCHVPSMTDTTLLPTGGGELKKGWMGMVAGSEGVWVGWEDVNGPGVARLEVGVKEDQRHYMTITPMPRLPDTAPKNATLQGMVFIPLDQERRIQSDGLASEFSESRKSSQESVAVACIYSEQQDTDGTPSTIQVLGFERREVEISESFSEISNPAETAHASDWSVIPDCLVSSTSPASTSILAIAPLPDIQNRTLALAILQTAAGPSLNHINLFPASSDGKAADDQSHWKVLCGRGIDLGELPSIKGLELVTSQSVDRGCLGLAAVVGRDFGAIPVVISALSENESSSDVEDISVAFFLAIKQGFDYSDVVRAVSGHIRADEQGSVVPDVLARAYTMIDNEVGVTSLAELLQLQVALYQSSQDARLQLAAELLHLLEASRLFSRCATSSSRGHIEFDLDSVWGLCGVAEWALTTLVELFRETVIVRGEFEWSASPDLDRFRRVLTVLHPGLRPLIVLVLAQVMAYSRFVLALERPILQTESRFLPSAIGKDARATVLLQERLRRLTDSLGVDMVAWGRAVTNLSKVPIDAVSEEQVVSSLVNLSLGPIRSVLQPLLAALPDHSSLFKSDLPEEEVYDCVTYLPITRLSPRETRATRAARCIRCGWRTVALRREDRSQVVVLVDEVEASWDATGWSGWKSERQTGCACGGSWIVE